MMSRTWSTAASRLLVLAAVVLMIPTAALATPPDQSGVVERAPELSAWVFWDGDGLIVLTGPPLEEGCFGEGFQFPIATTVQPPSGATLTSYHHTDQVWVYDDEGTSDPIDWLFGRACAAVAAGDPAPEPLAHGEGRVSVNSRIDADGVEHGHLGVTARVTSADGRRVHLRAFGELGGITTDFINYGG